MTKYAEDLGHGEERVFHVLEVVQQGRTAYQRIDILRTEGYGLALFLDGSRQSSEADEFIYHEMLVHPALFRHPSPAKVFVAGGGEGAVAREVLRHKSVETLTQVDIDGEVLGACKRWLPTWSDGAFESPRMNLIVGDALRYLEETNERYDVILLDLPEWAPESPAQALYSAEFYGLVRSRLALGGVVGLQVGPVHPVHIEPFSTVARRLRAVFHEVLLYPVTELRWGFAVCGNCLSLDAPFEPERLASRLRYYNAGLHGNMGALPTYLWEALA